MIPPHSRYWHLSICLTLVRRLVSRCRRNQFKMFVARRWQLVSHQRLFQIASEPDASYGIQKAGNSWLHIVNHTCWSRRYGWKVMNPSLCSPRLAHTHFSALEAVKNYLAGKQFADRRQREASCHFLATGTYHRFLRPPDLSFGCHDGTDA